MAAALLRALMALFICIAAIAAEYPKAYLSNGQIWIQASPSQAAFQATHDGTEKSGPHVSPDGNLILYDVRESLGENRLSPLNLVFLDWTGKEVRRFKEVRMKDLADDVCGYGTTEWIDNDRVGVACEFNPSGEDYLILNAVTGKTEKEYPGLYFSWSPDHKILAHIGWIIHFATPASQNYCVLFNDKTVYTPGCRSEVDESVTSKRPGARAGRQGNAGAEVHHYKNIHTVDYPLVWSPSGRYLAFAEVIYDFDWGMEDGQETRDTANYRYFLTVISQERPAVGYRLSQPIVQPRLEWLDDSHIRLRGASDREGLDRTFDLITDPPKKM